jgi:hypothetical protein
MSIILIKIDNTCISLFSLGGGGGWDKTKISFILCLNEISSIKVNKKLSKKKVFLKELKV